MDQGLLIVKDSWSHSVRHTTLGRTPLDEWPARRSDLYLTTHNSHKRQASMPPAGFEPAILGSERPQTHTLDHVATGIGFTSITYCITVFCQSQWPHDLMYRSVATRFLGLRVLIPPGARMTVCCECCVLSGRGLCVVLITRPEKSYWLWCVWVWS